MRLAMEPDIDMDGGKEPNIIISRRTFEHNGRQVEELIYHKDTDEGVLGLAWALFPFDKVCADGYPNPIFHLTLSGRSEEEVRKDIRESFDLYYSGTPGQRKYDLIFKASQQK